MGKLWVAATSGPLPVQGRPPNEEGSLHCLIVAGKKQKKNISWRENYMKCSIKFYWNTGSHIRVCILYGCFCQQNRVVAAETVWSAKPKIFPLWSFSEKVSSVSRLPYREGPDVWKVFLAHRWWASWASWPSSVAVDCTLDAAAERTGSCPMCPPANMLSWVGWFKFLFSSPIHHRAPQPCLSTGRPISANFHVKSASFRQDWDHHLISHKQFGVIRLTWVRVKPELKKWGSLPTNP